MDISSLGSSAAAPRSTASTSAEIADTTQQSASNETQVSQEDHTSAVPPVQASSDLGGEEGSVVTQDNSGSTNAQASESGSGGQVDVVA